MDSHSPGIFKPRNPSVISVSTHLTPSAINSLYRASMSTQRMIAVAALCLASEGRHVVASRCPRQTKCYASTGLRLWVGWDTHSVDDQGPGHRYERSGGRDWGGDEEPCLQVSPSRATCPKTEVCQRQKMRQRSLTVRCRTSSFPTRSYHQIPNSHLTHYWWLYIGY